MTLTENKDLSEEDLYLEWLDSEEEKRKEHFQTIKKISCQRGKFFPKIHFV